MDMIIYLRSQETHLTDLLELMRSAGWTLLLQLPSHFPQSSISSALLDHSSSSISCLKNKKNPSLYLTFPSSCYHIFMLLSTTKLLKELTSFLWPNITSAHVNWIPSAPHHWHYSCQGSQWLPCCWIQWWHFYPQLGVALKAIEGLFKKNFYWSIVDLQCCVSFGCTAKWISYT